MSDISDSPKLEGGWCDGLGCGRHDPCWCEAHLAMKEEFQRLYNKPWDDNDVDCKRVDTLWRLGTEAYQEHYVKRVKEERTYGETIYAGAKKQHTKLKGKIREVINSDTTNPKAEIKKIVNSDLLC